ncbi:DUF7217 family protein [Marinomonas transparens]|uniref:DUF7217 domain-containing protein n=1 Tax=Marinomonas transparens TaxID=2795388 RepID=A0A934N1Q5_9GAMM|nr:hypothetical protein [Marinomonas transparens]MBJ7536963.1 hypothetical protein [Marinomonas transparens]
MAFDVNKGLFNALGAGNAFTSLTTSKATATNTQAAQLRIKLDKYLPFEEQIIIDPTLPDETKVTNCQNALLNYGTGANTLNAHVQKRLDSLLDDMQVASAVKGLDSYISDVPESCANINTIAGTLSGATDSLLAASTSIMDELEDGIAAFDGGTMELEPFEALLDKVTAELASSLTALLGKISNEARMVENMYTSFHQMAKSAQVEGLINDPCVRPFLVQLAGPELSKVLVDDFGIDEVKEVLG